MALSLILVRGEKRAVTSLYSDQSAALPDFYHGRVQRTEVFLVDRLKSPVGTRIFEPIDLTDWTVRSALGQVYELPTAGTFTLTYGTDTTSALAYNATAATVSTAFNLLASVISAGGATVTGGPGLYTVTFTDIGARTAISANVSNLAPTCISDIGTLVDGSVSLSEVQSVRIIQNPGAWVSLTDPTSTGPDSTVTVVQVGGSGLNAKVRIKLENAPYDGSWTIAHTDIAGPDTAETSLLTYNATAATVQTALEALATIGTGNVEVVKEADFTYLIAFKGDLADTDIGTLEPDHSALLVMIGRQGNLDCRTAALSILLGDEDTIGCTFEIEANDSGDVPDTYLQSSVTVRASLFPDSGSLTTVPAIPPLGFSIGGQAGGIYQFQVNAAGEGVIVTMS